MNGTTEATVSRPRWLRFSLRTLLFLLTALAVCLYVGWHWRNERELKNGLRTAKVKAAQAWWDSMQVNMGEPPEWSFGDLCRASIALKDAQLEITSDKRGRIRALTSHRDRMEAKFRVIDALYAAGARGGDSYLRAEAEYRLIEANTWLKEEEIK